MSKLADASVLTCPRMSLSLSGVTALSLLITPFLLQVGMRLLPRVRSSGTLGGSAPHLELAALVGCAAQPSCLPFQHTPLTLWLLLLLP